MNSLLVGVARSLHSGTIRNCCFTVPFKLDVFRYLFDELRGLNKEDFRTDVFPDDWFVVYDEHGNGCMTPRLKYGPKSFVKCDDGSVKTKPRLCTEIVCVDLCKKS